MKKYADRIFKWFCHPEYYPDIKGDLEELYQDHLEAHQKSATRKYLGDVILLFRPSLMRPLFKNSNILITLSMLANHFKIAVRMSKQHISFTTINVLGLALGLAISLLIIQYVRFELSYEDMHTHAERIVRPTMDYMNGETLIDQDCETYPPLGPLMTAELPEVISFARMYNQEHISMLQAGEKFFQSGKVYAADSSFFTLFNYPLIHGSEIDLFKNPFEAVLTKSRALAFFDREDPIGEVISIPDADNANFKVVGIIEDVPINTHLKFDMLVSYPTLYKFGEKDDNWNGNNTLTYVQLAPGVSFQDFENKMASFNQQLIDEEKLSNEWVAVQPMKDIHLYSHKSFEAEVNGNAQSVYLLLVVAILVMLIAYVNYINLATSKALDRAKEVGVRKVVGSSVSQLRVQFLVESFFINVLAISLSLVMMILSKGYFLNIADLPKSFVLFGDPMLWMIVLGLLFAGTLFSGIYPAFVLSRFKVSTVLKGTYAKSSQGALLRRLLVVLQFAITIILLVQTLTVNEQLTFMRDKELGVDVEQTIVVEMPSINDRDQRFNAFFDGLRNQSYVSSVASSDVVPGLPDGEFGTTTGINPVDAIEKQNFNFYITFIDSAFIPTMKIELLAGSNYDIESKWDQNLIVNEEAVRLWGFSSPEDAIDKKINFWGEQIRIKGVVKNYHQESAKSAHIPIIMLAREGFSRLTSIRVKTEEVQKYVGGIKTLYDQNFPNRPFSYFFLDQKYDQQFRADEKFRQVFGILTVFAIVIACLGLFGLASFIVGKRTKEIGIRKVLGASSKQIVVLLSNDFVRTILFAIGLAIPVSYFMINEWLQGYAFRMDLNIWLFIIPSVLVIFLALISMSFKTIQTSIGNPVDSLRDE